MIRTIQFVATVALILTLVACGSDNDSALRDQIAMLEMERDEAAIARMTAEGQVADRQAEVAGLQAEVEQLKGEITMLMSRADRSPADLATLQAKVETLTGEIAELEADRMAAETEQQARLDAQAMAAVGHLGLARSPHPPAYAVSDQDTLANLQPGGEGVFAPLSSVLRRALNVRFPDDGAAYVKSISGDGEGGFNMTWVIGGVESPVHFPADAYNPENFAFQHTDEADDHHRSYGLFGWTDSLYPSSFQGQRRTERTGQRN